jgi:hypothetical protein
MNTIEAFASNLAYETSTPVEKATEIAQWLVAEGVLDMPVLTDTYAEQDPLGANDNEQAVA